MKQARDLTPVDEHTFADRYFQVGKYVRECPRKYDEARKIQRSLVDSATDKNWMFKKHKQKEHEDKNKRRAEIIVGSVTGWRQGYMVRIEVRTHEARITVENGDEEVLAEMQFPADGYDRSRVVRAATGVIGHDLVG